jgi:hypothetical protein
MDVASFTLGEPLAGSCFSAVEDLLECMEPKELSAITEEPALYAFGLVSGLARKQLTV